MSYQFDEPSAVYHGTFARHHGEPHPPANAVIWRDYDPNWREFIGTVFIILLKDFGELLPAELQNQMRHAIRLAAEGAFERKVAAEYTNISLMSAFLLDYAGELHQNQSLEGLCPQAGARNSRAVQPLPDFQRVQLAHLLRGRFLRPRIVA